MRQMTLKALTPKHPVSRQVLWGADLETRNDLTLWHARSGNSSLRRRWGYWSIVGALMSALAVGAPVGAQVPAPEAESLAKVASPAPESLFRLSVRRAMATGTRTVKAGVDTLQVPGARNFFVYVPQQCVGTRRVPLVVYVHGGGWNSTMQLEAQRDLADKYGMILLLPNGIDGNQDVFNAATTGTIEVTPSPLFGTTKVLKSGNEDARAIDTAMKLVLRQYAIDPDKIAIMGFSNGGSYSLLLGRNNLDVFSRVGAGSALFPLYGESPASSKVMFFLSAGTKEGIGRQTFGVAQELHDEGHDVKTVYEIRDHVAQRGDDDYMWNWLANSWGTSTARPAEHRTPRALPAPSADPVLTVEALLKMAIFWSNFTKASDSTSVASRTAYQQDVIQSFTWERIPITVVTIDVAAMARQNPAVVAALANAGLTAEQEEAYRMALIRAELFRSVGTRASGPIAETSTLGQNIAFWKTHPTELEVLDHAGIWTIPPQ
jgi:poly(3-hydroxybutyrate) depolymerase